MLKSISQPTLEKKTRLIRRSIYTKYLQQIYTKYLQQVKNAQGRLTQVNPHIPKKKLPKPQKRNYPHSNKSQIATSP